MSQLTIRVEKLVPGGHGFARSNDGRVVLLQQVAPGDEVEVLESQQRKGFIQVTRWRLLQAAPHRVEPECPLAERCGGCDWMMLDDTAQHSAKLALIREALARTGKIRDLPEPVRLISSPKRLGYRSRIRLQVAGDRVGFYSADSHDLVEAPNCAVADERVNTALVQLREAARRYPGALSSFAQVEIRSAPDGSVSLYFTRAHNGRAETPATQRLLQHLAHAALAVCSDDAPADETRWQRYPLNAETTLLSPPGTFTQVNWAVNTLLVEELLRAASERKLGRFLELYCGSGNFTLPLLRAGFGGIAVENDARAIVAARRAAREQGLDSGGFLVESVEKFLQRHNDERFDWVLIDPPRAGIKQGIERIVRLAPRFIAICSCDPVTLARDLRQFIDAGYTLQQLTAFDMFPQTHHVETLTWLMASRAS